MDNEKIPVIKIKARHAYTMFPKKPTILGTEGNTFGITVWNVVENIEGDPKTDSMGNVTITGTFEEIIDKDKVYTILAKQTTHEKYGLQYEVIFIGELKDLANAYNQKAFLQVFLSELQIQEMFKVLENPLKTIEDGDIESLKKVHGIGDYIAQCILDRFEENKDNSAIYLELDGLGLTPKFIQKLITKYKNPNVVIETIKNNPYKLSFDIEGIGFKTADKIALSCGLSEKSPERIKGFINYLLVTLAESGTSYITSGELTSYIFSEFNGKDNILDIYIEDGVIIGNNISQAIEELIKKDILVVEDNGEKSQRRVYLKKYWNLENNIAINLKRIIDSENNFDYQCWEKVIKEQESKQGWKFTEEQKQGIQLGLENQVCLVAGGAGVGKSSLVSGVLQALKRYSFEQTALSGKASARLQEVTGEEGKTIHRLLGFNPTTGFKYNEYNRLESKIIVLDEISLVGGEIFLSLIKAIPNGCKLIILGDMGQLESIGCLNLASDLFHSNFVPTIELTKIHRQAQKSGIILAAYKVRNNEILFERDFEGGFTSGELEDMHFDISSSSDDTRKKVSEHFKEYYNSSIVNKDIMDIQVLAPVKERGDASVFNLNSDIQEIINPQDDLKEELEIIYKDKVFTLRENDKIMCIQNKYKIFTKDGGTTDVFNGWTGIITEIDTFSERVVVFFPISKTEVVFTKQQARECLILGYASTVHKYQGSSAKVIIGVLDYSTPPTMRTRELLYTMLTRAEKSCTLIAQNKAVDDAIKCSGVSNKKTFLLEMLNDYIKER